MPTRELADINCRILKKFLELIYKMTGITMQETKRDLIQGRMRSRIVELNMKSFDEYYYFLESNRDEHQIFIDSITTHETYFFRTSRVWNYLMNDYLPRWHAKNPNTWLRIWSAACSTGEEAYTIAICCEEFKLKHPSFRYEIYATDIATDVIAKGQQGVYEGRSVELFQRDNKKIFEKYLVKNGNHYSVIEHVRKNVKFSRLNLLGDKMEMQPFDLIFLRNVLIYFALNEKEKAIANVAKKAKDECELIIGESESVRGLNVPFSYVSPSIYKKTA